MSEPLVNGDASGLIRPEITNLSQHEEPSNPAENIDPLAELRADQDFTALKGFKQVIMALPVRRPKPTEFFRTPIKKTHWFDCYAFEYGEGLQGEIYPVGPKMRLILPQAKPVTLTLFSTQFHQMFFWMLKRSDRDGRWNNWHKIAFEAAELATTNQINIVASEGNYKVTEGDKELFSEPQWPEDLNFNELLKLSVPPEKWILSMDHPMVKILTGKKA
ncbi:MAG: hypothetical protein JO356_12550 [Acidobacteria bacterium]|nr:hypothetical protein [Acidobacteriota bacterium]